MKTFSTSSGDKRKLNERRMIYEMMEASMALSLKKGPHRLKKGCSCIVCVNKRKQILNGPVKEWEFKL
jgi:hypothetical protein